MKKIILIFLAFILFYSCENPQREEEKIKTDYLDYSSKDDILSGGVKIIPIQTESGEFNVWTKRIGNNPSMKVLLLHGGPGATHEYLEAFDSYFPNAEIEYYYYDQLESYYSDQPNDSTLWTVERYVDEVEQVRIALGLNKDNFYLYGSSWGGILCMDNIKISKQFKGLIISTYASTEYVDYANNVLGPQLDSAVLAEIREMESKEDYST